MNRLYSLRKARKILFWSYSYFEKKTLLPATLSQMETKLRALEEAIDRGERKLADQLARELETFTHTHFKKSSLAYFAELGVAILFALVVATLVRQVWFELYEIPTGSMRPSFREEDHLSVTKTTFGLNIPLQTNHFYFDPDLVKRGGVVIFSGDQVPFIDVNTTYFGVIPYKKRYIKRLVGKPGDVLYFYGGMIYGIDKEGRPIDDLLSNPWMQKIEHIPFVTFEGRAASKGRNQILFYQMNRPIARLSYTRSREPRGELFNGKEWVVERPFDKRANQNGPLAFGDFWGIHHFAKARLLTREQLKEYPGELKEGLLYLQLSHHPNLTYPAPHFYEERGGLGLQLPTFHSIIPLQRRHLDAIMDQIYTARFVVKGGKAKRYQLNPSPLQEGLDLADVPDGTYEFTHGQLEKVGWKGWTTLLPEDHPLYQRTTERIQALFNSGIQFDPASSRTKGPLPVRYPNRYAYFRNGDLYLMGAPILKKSDPTLVRFLKREELREQSTRHPYLAFKDRGAPLLQDGSYDVATIQKFGIQVPDRHYLVLGDNHAMSSDSRAFGFVPEENLQGTPSLLLWPPNQGRWGMPPQIPDSFFSLPRLIVWGIVSCLLLVWYLAHRRRLAKKLFKTQVV